MLVGTGALPGYSIHLPKMDGVSVELSHVVVFDNLHPSVASDLPSAGHAIAYTTMLNHKYNEWFPLHLSRWLKSGRTPSFRDTKVRIVWQGHLSQRLRARGNQSCDL